MLDPEYQDEPVLIANRFDYEAYCAVPVGVQEPSRDDKQVIELSNNLDIARRTLALRRHRDEWLHEAWIDNEDKIISMGNKAWLVVTEAEAETKMELAMRKRLRKAVPAPYVEFIDMERYMDYARKLGRGQALAPFDHLEVVVTTRSGGYFIYRQK